MAHDGQFTLVVGALYGLFSGVFAGRAARLGRLAMAARPDASLLQHLRNRLALQRDPW